MLMIFFPKTSNYLDLSVMRKTTKLAARNENPNIMLAEYAKDEPLKASLASVSISERADCGRG